MSTRNHPTKRSEPQAPPCAPAPPALAVVAITAGGVSHRRGVRRRPSSAAHPRGRHRRGRHPLRDRRGAGLRRRVPRLRQPVRHPGLHLPRRHAHRQQRRQPRRHARVPGQGHRRVVLSAATSSLTAPTPPKARGCSPPSSSPSATTPTPAQDHRRHRLRGRRSRRHRHRRDHRRHRPLRHRSRRSRPGTARLEQPELPTMGINKTVELEIGR